MSVRRTLRVQINIQVRKGTDYACSAKKGNCKCLVYRLFNSIPLFFVDAFSFGSIVVHCPIVDKASHGVTKAAFRLVFDAFPFGIFLCSDFEFTAPKLDVRD